MSYKLSFILSLLFVFMFYLFGIDMINIQFIYTDLDQDAVTIGYLIAKQGNLDIIPKLEKQFDVSIKYIGNEYPKFGDAVTFQVQEAFQPLIISNDPLYVTVERTTIIGYYN